jgi:hypothetical protein
LLQLLQPLWLGAMAGIAAPVLLHLWNDRQGKVLPVGSVALLERRSPRQRWSRRLSEWWLLLLRCLLLMALALLLAGPSWRSGPGGKAGWILEEGAGAHAGAGPADIDRWYKPLIDSLLKAGYERRVWDGSPAGAAWDGAPAGAAMGVGERSYWDGFRAADKAAPGGMPFYVFTTGWASRFQGSRPSTDRPVHWYIYTPTDSVSRWIGGAWLSSPDSIRIAEGSSGPTGSSYSYRMAPAGRLPVSPDSQPPVTVDTAVVRIAIYADPDHMHDSRYLAAAVRALEEFSRRRIELRISGTMPGKKVDWLFWLSPQPIPAGDRAKHVLQYEPGRAVPVDTRVQGVDIGKEISADRDYETIWKDGYGRTLLGLERTEHGEVYHFFSRFDPEWNGLVWSRSFPVWLERLVFGGSEDRQDRRVLDPEQILPVKKEVAGNERAEAGERIKADGAEIAAGTRGFDLGPACWILIVLLFILERVVSFATTQTKNYGVAGREK